MGLTPAADRFLKKKWIMDLLSERPLRDTVLAYREFGIQEPRTYDSPEDLIEKLISAIGPGRLDELYDALRADGGGGGTEPPTSDFLREDQENTTFEEQEQRQIAQVVADVLEEARNSWDLPPSQLQLLEPKLQYVSETAPRLGRVDWVNCTVGALIGSFAGGVLTQDVWEKVLKALWAGVGVLFHAHGISPMLNP
jgi:hypothetical protein